MFRRLTLLIVVTLFSSFLIQFPAFAQFDPLGQVCEGNSDAVACQENAQGQTGGENPVNTTAAAAVNILSVVIATIAVIIIVIAGINMALSQGDSGKIKTARDAVIYAVVGLIVVSLARVLVLFVIDRASS